MVNIRSPLNVGAIPSEDCLQLNIWGPWHANKASRLPVLVYIFGGAFKDSYSFFFAYPHGARNIISDNNDVIIVSMNYRMGAFGFLPASELASEGGLNLGLQGFYRK
jgi:acetylcholinesterase